MTKERLKEYLDILEEIKELEEDLLEFETKATNITSVISDMPRGSSMIQDKMAERAVKIADQKEKIKCKIAIKYSLKDEIEEAIEKLPSTYRKVLRARYIRGLAWEEVCVKLKYEWAQTHRYHGEALKLLDADKK